MRSWIAATLRRANAETAGSVVRLFADFLAEHEVRYFALEESLLLRALPADARAPARARPAGGVRAVSYLEQALDPAVLQHIGDRLTGER
jgi:hypothetical protein